MAFPDPPTLSMVYRVLRWYLGRDDVEADISHVVYGGPLAMVGGTWDDLAGFAERLAPERAVLDLSRRTPSARELRELFASQPDAIVLAERAEHVVRALGVIAQPWYMPVMSLSARPRDALSLLREAVAQLGVSRALDELGVDVVAGLGAYPWPRGLHELREASLRIAAWLDSGNASGAARRLDVTRQAVAKYLARRIARGAGG